jgi:hypothetical protein
MSVTAEMVVTIAEVEVTDDYTIDLHVPEARKKHLTLTTDEAEQLGTELIESAIVARKALREDIEARGIAQISHAFDTDERPAS